ncbi:hypothetical protein ACHAPF_009136 [Botrytis cinerea]
MGAKKPPGVPGSFFGPGGPQAQIPGPLSAADQAAADKAATDKEAADLLAADLLAAGNAVGNQAAAVQAAENLLALPGPEDEPQGYGGDEANQKPSGPWEDAPPLEEDAAASAARVAPVDIQFNNVVRANLLPLMASGIHPVSTSGGGHLCGLHALIYSYNALRDLSAPEGTPVPLADNPTAKDLQLYRSGPQFYQDVIEFLRPQNILVFADSEGEPLSEEQVMRQVTGIVPNMVDNYDVNVLHSLLIHLNRTDLDQGLIAEANSWFGDDIDEYLNEPVWIVTADVEGYHVDLEDHQDPRELRLYSGCFVREPTVAPDEDAPDGYMWVQRTPFFVVDVETPGAIGIAPLKSLKMIVKNALRKAHDAAGATAANIIKRTGVIVDDKGPWQDFLVHRTIEPTTKINARYANPNDPAKKFVGGFQFEDGEFLLDTQESLKNLYPRMIRIDGTRGRVKPRNLQFLERAWKLPERIPIAASGTQKTPSTSMPPGKQNLLGTSNKSDPKYKYRPTMKVEDFKITDLRNHCKARGMVAKDYGRTKVGMLAKLVEHDQKADKVVKPSGNQVGKPAESGNFLPMRRVLVDIAKEAGPPKMPPFFATEIVMELGKGDINNPATWIIDYEGRIGRVPDDNLEPLDRAWGVELDPVRWIHSLAEMRKNLGYDKPPKPAKNPPDPSNNPSDPAKNPPDPVSKPVGKKAKVVSANPPDPNSQASSPPAGNATGKKRPASSSAEQPAKKKKQKKKKKK